jgi:hypothetical protein
MRHCVLRPLILIAATLCPLCLAQNSNQHVYIGCNAPTNTDVWCGGDCGGNWLQTSTPGPVGSMDLVDPTECNSAILGCQYPTANQEDYLAVTDSEFGCNGSNTGCDPTNSDVAPCPDGSTCSSSDGPGICVPNQPAGPGGCIQENSSGCVPNSEPGCCTPSDTCIAASGAKGVCRLTSPCGSATDPNCPTAVCNALTGQWDESSCPVSCTVGNDSVCADAGGNCMCNSYDENNGGPGTCGASLNVNATCNCDSDCAGTEACISGNCGYECDGDYDPNCDTAVCNTSNGTWDDTSCQNIGCAVGNDNSCASFGGNCMCEWAGESDGSVGACGVSGGQGAGCLCDSDCAGSLGCSSGTCLYECAGSGACSASVCTSNGWDDSGCSSGFICVGPPPCSGAICDDIGWDASSCGGSSCDTDSDPCCVNGSDPGDPGNGNGNNGNCSDIWEDCTITACCDGGWCDDGQCELDDW